MKDMLNGWVNPDEREMERRSLKRDAAFIGTGMLLQTLLMQFFFTVVIMFLLLLGIVRPDAVQNDLEAQGKAAPAEKKEKPPVGETVGFRMARQFAETEPGFKDFIVALANKLQNG